MRVLLKERTHLQLGLEGNLLVATLLSVGLLPVLPVGLLRGLSLLKEVSHAFSLFFCFFQFFDE